MTARAPTVHVCDVLLFPGIPEAGTGEREGEEERERDRTREREGGREREEERDTGLNTQVKISNT